MNGFSTCEDNSLKVKVSSRVGPSQGQPIYYWMSAVASHNNHPYAEYHDDPPRFHDESEDGRLDLDGETREFANLIAEDLEKSGIRTSADGLVIQLQKQ